VEEINVYMSVFPEGEGLLPEDRWEGLRLQPDVDDYNPNRVLTAQWKPSDGDNWIWTGNGESLSVPRSDSSPVPKQFSLPEGLELTGGQTYHWAVEVTINGEKHRKTGKFNTPLGAGATTNGNNAFSSVTVLTQGPERENAEYNRSIKEQIDLIARQIEKANGLVMRYQPSSATWEPVTYNQTESIKDWETSTKNVSDYYGKPLVLLADWVGNTNFANFDNSGFSEAAADSLYASLVELDLQHGGEVGNGGIYDGDGNLNRERGAVLKSPLHFVGFSRGAVVNTEIVQRLGKFFPEIGATGDASNDLQVTTIDAYQYNNRQPFSLDNIPEPSIETWANVNYADNYYQSRDSNRYKEITTADFNRNLKDFAKFEEDSHKKALSWYVGTGNLNESEGIIRRLGDLPDFNKPESTWYTPDHTGVSFEHGAQDAPWEGIGTGWFYSVLGGGKDLRNDALLENRIPVRLDNTPKAAMGGDDAVPTLFNGNFDAVFAPIDNQTIPGWSSSRQKALKDVTGIPGATSYSDGISNYALQLGGQNSSTATHDLFMIPDWGNLRFDLYAPNATNAAATLNVKLKTAAGGEKNVTINLQEANFTINNSNKNNLQEIKQIYSDSKNQLGFAKKGFETFQLNLQLDDSKLLKFRGQPASLTFSLENSTGSVYIDNVFFKSDYLKFRNPTEARWAPGSSTYQNNLLLEKPQYALSYNAETKHANWVGWKVDSSWVRPLPTPPGTGLEKRPEFIADEDLPNKFQYDGNIFAGLGMNRGHLSPNRDRRRHPKDQLATYLSTNLIAQSMDNNLIFVPGSDNPSDASAWFNIETAVAKRASQGEELYIFAGAFGNNWEPQQKTRVPELWNKVENGEYINRKKTVPSNLSASTRQIHIPTWTWKAIIPENSFSPTVGPVAYLTPNTAEPVLDWSRQPDGGYPHPLNQFLGNRDNITSPEQWRNPETWKLTLPELRGILNDQTNLPKFEFSWMIDEEIDF
jgi:DNA/RNA endonuclease G (NUC1)